MSDSKNMDLTPEPPQTPEIMPPNIIPINEEVGKDLLIGRKEPDPLAYPCSGIHKAIVVDPVNRTVTCKQCGFAIDPFAYLDAWAREGAHKVTGLKDLSIKLKIAHAEHEDLMRKIKNLRQRLKRSGEPQPEVERSKFDIMRWNPNNSETRKFLCNE